MKNHAARNIPVNKKSGNEICSDTVRAELRNFRQLKKKLKNAPNPPLSKSPNQKPAASDNHKGSSILSSKTSKIRNLSPIEIDTPSLNTENKSLGLLSSILSPRKYFHFLNILKRGEKYDKNHQNFSKKAINRINFSKKHLKLWRC